MEGGASSSAGPAPEQKSTTSGATVTSRATVHDRRSPGAASLALDGSGSVGMVSPRGVLHGVLHRAGDHGTHHNHLSHPQFAGSMADLDENAKAVVAKPVVSPRGSSRIASMVGDINKREDVRKSMVSVRHAQPGGANISPRGSVASRATNFNHGRASMASTHMSALQRGSVAPVSVPLITCEAADMLLHEMEAALHKLDASQGKAVKLIKAELEVLTLFERFALLTDGAMRSQKGEAQEIFGGDGTRLARGLAVIESVEFSDANKKDRRIDGLVKKLTAVEVLVRDHQDKLKAARGSAASGRMIARQKVVLNDKRNAVNRFRAAGWVARMMVGLVSSTKDQERAAESAGPDFEDGTTSRIVVDPTGSKSMGGDDPFLLSDKESSADSASDDGERPQEKWAENELGVDVQAAAPESLMLMIPGKKTDEYDRAVREGQDAKDDNIWSQYFDLIFVRGDED